MIVAGWTLVYLPHMPEGFFFSSSLRPAESSDVVASAYLSLVTVGTLGFGDIVPAEPALRLVVPLQALVGFVLLTAVISWVLQVYPALARRRAAARHLGLMAATDTETLVENAGDAAAVVPLLQFLVAELTTVRMELLQYSESYYFRETDAELSLAASLPYALDLVAAGKRSARDEVRQVAAMLELAVSDLAGVLEQFVGEHAAVAAVLDAFAADHGQRPLRGRG